MRSIKQLIQELNTKENQRIFDALKTSDDNTIELLNRVEALEKKNMRYYCRAYSEGAYNIPAATTPFPFDSTEYPQYGNMHDNAVENTKIWIRRNGVYHMGAGLIWANNMGGSYRAIQIRVTGSRGSFYIATYLSPLIAVVGVYQSLSVSYYLYEGDYVELVTSQNSGVAIALNIEYARSPYIYVAERMEDLSPAEYGLIDPGKNAR